MAEVGHFALLASLAAAVYGVVATVFALRLHDEGFRAAGARGVHVYAAFIVLAAAALITALVTRQFQVRFVAEVTSRDLPLLYTISAFWGGHAGSLLLWALVLAAYALAAQRTLRGQGELAPYVTIVVLATGAFFSGALAFSSNPFATVPVPPPDGRGLNPLLRNPWMAVHPPALYLGFVGMTVPYALAIGALATRRSGDDWIRLARGWVLTAWWFLTAGLLFGARWSYAVLGWGGYWAWDPVENAALMPWLTATAFLHSIQAQERRGLFAAWTAALMIMSFGLAIFGTFLTRSGLLSSVHAFANATIGIYLLGFLAAALAAGFGLLFWRLPALRREAHLESLLSREAAFAANNALLLVGTFAVLLGTIFPILAEVATGDRIAVGPPYFTLVLGPVVILLLALMAVGPLLPWRGGRADALGRSLAAPGATAVLAGLALAALGVRGAGVLTLLILSVFVGSTILVEFHVGVRARSGPPISIIPALLRLVARNRRRYGGYIVHFGLLLIMAAATVSSAFSTAAQGTLSPGETMPIGLYDVRYDGAQMTRSPGLRITAVTVTVRRGGRVEGVLRPRHIVHTVRDEATADVAIRSSWQDDLYVVLVGTSRDGRATFRLAVNPMVTWLWIGALVMLLGGFIAALPRRQREGVAAARYAETPAAVAGGNR